MKHPFALILRISVACLAIGFSATATAADLTPCQVLTEADVRAVLGAAWKRNAAFSEGEVCAYQSVPTAVVTLILTRDSSGADFNLTGRKKLAGDKAKPAAGPGAGAYRVSTKLANAIVFGKGEWVGQIEATPAVTQDLGVLDRLAKGAYDRLP